MKMVLISTVPTPKQRVSLSFNNSLIYAIHWRMLFDDRALITLHLKGFF